MHSSEHFWLFHSLKMWLFFIGKSFMQNIQKSRNVKASQLYITEQLRTLTANYNKIKKILCATFYFSSINTSLSKLNLNYTSYTREWKKKVRQKQGIFFNITTSACVCICLQALDSTPSFLHKTWPKPFRVTGLILTIVLNIRMINGCFCSKTTIFGVNSAQLGP